MSPAIKCLSMVRVLFTNPNSDLTCSDAAPAALARLHFAASPDAGGCHPCRGTASDMRLTRLARGGRTDVPHRRARGAPDLRGDRFVPVCRRSYVLSRTEPHRHAPTTGPFAVMVWPVAANAVERTRHLFSDPPSPFVARLPPPSRDPNKAGPAQGASATSSGLQPLARDLTLGRRAHARQSRVAFRIACHRSSA